MRERERYLLASHSKWSKWYTNEMSIGVSTSEGYVCSLCWWAVHQKVRGVWENLQQLQQLQQIVTQDPTGPLYIVLSWSAWELAWASPWTETGNSYFVDLSQGKRACNEKFSITSLKFITTFLHMPLLQWKCSACCPLRPFLLWFKLCIPGPTCHILNHGKPYSSLTASCQIPLPPWWPIRTWPTQLTLVSPSSQILYLCLYCILHFIILVPKLQLLL